MISQCALFFFLCCDHNIISSIYTRSLSTISYHTFFTSSCVLCLLFSANKLFSFLYVLYAVVRGSSQDIGQRERSVISRALNYVLINDGTRLARLLTRYLRHRSIKTENNNERSLQATSNKQQQANSAITVVPKQEDGTTNCCIVVLCGSK